MRIQERQTSIHLPPPCPQYHLPPSLPKVLPEYHGKSMIQAHNGSLTNVGFVCIIMKEN